MKSSRIAMIVAGLILFVIVVALLWGFVDCSNGQSGSGSFMGSSGDDSTTTGGSGGSGGSA